MKKIIIVLAVAVAVIYGAIGTIDTGKQIAAKYQEKVDQVVNRGK